LCNSAEPNVKAVFDKLIGGVEELRKRVESLETGKHTGIVLFVFLIVSEMMDMEQTYHELEMTFFDLRKSLLSQTQEIEALRTELKDERTKKSELSVLLYVPSYR